MDAVQAVNYIHSLLPFGIMPGLERIAALCEKLGNPQDRLRFVHVAGTNGKGSTSTMLASILTAAGYRTGLFTSPYVLDFRERIQLDGAMIPPQELAEAVSRVREANEALALEDITVTEFEAITAAAFVFFARMQCDLVVLEVGLGGRFDATNLIQTPLVSVLCSISMDHMAVLGDKLEQIAFEKCGILKPGGICICYPEQDAAAMEVIRRIAGEQGNSLRVPDSGDIRVVRESLRGSEIQYRGQALTVPLVGKHMVKNAAVVLETLAALRELCYALPEKAVSAGLAETKMPARMELLREKPYILLDGGHNEGCAAALRAVLEQFLPDKRITAVCAMMADKDYARYLSVLAPCLDRLIATQLNMERALPAQTLCGRAQSLNICSEAQATPEAALQAALQIAGRDGAVLICGSFYLAARLRPLLEG